jgi:exosortase/archaeosortase family protein
MKSEIRNPKSERNPKSKGRIDRADAGFFSAFGFRPSFGFRISDFGFYLLPACILGFLWISLINHLRAEWFVNPQYSYGWAVPFLCVFLLVRRFKETTGSAGIPAGEVLEGANTRAEARPKSGLAGRMPALPVVASSCAGPVVLWSLALCALLYFPTRLIQEANPEWRLVSWALAVEIIGMTLLILPWALDSFHASRITHHEKGDTYHIAATTPHAPRSTLHTFLFPLCFFLVAVPWPTFIEVPFIQWLARANAAMTVELLGFLGFPALQHGNLIEVGTGIVGIDEACSGIRSVQATLMISLFFGEFYRLRLLRRIACVLAGLGFSFLFNISRTTLLTVVAARQGIPAIDKWHDPAGVAILLGCFFALWLVARGMQRAEVQSPKSVPPVVLEAAGVDSRFTFHVSRFPLLYALAAWLLVTEFGTELWYRLHESHLPAPVSWSVNLPRDNPTFRSIPISRASRQYLHYDEGVSASWREGDNSLWQAIFLRWKPGRIAVHLARNHTPEICLPASGRHVTAQSNGRRFLAGGLQLPFSLYRVKDEAGPLYVFYCLWEDRAAQQNSSTMELSYGRRLGPVLEGRRNSGQRSLEVALWGMRDEQQAEAAFAQQLQKLIRTTGSGGSTVLP